MGKAVDFSWFVLRGRCWLTNARVVKKIELELELIQTQMVHKPMLRAEVYARALRASQNVKRAEVWVGANYGLAGRGRVREWKALVWGVVISEVGLYSLCDATPRRFCVAPLNLAVWVGESGSGRLFPRGGKSSWLGCRCGAGFRASAWRPRRRRWRGAARLRRRSAP
jgi:hypothetical protein